MLDYFLIRVAHIYIYTNTNQWISLDMNTVDLKKEANIWKLKKCHT